MTDTCQEVNQLIHIVIWGKLKCGNLYVMSDFQLC